MESLMFKNDLFNIKDTILTWLLTPDFFLQRIHWENLRSYTVTHVGTLRSGKKQKDIALSYVLFPKMSLVKHSHRALQVTLHFRKGMTIQPEPFIEKWKSPELEHWINLPVFFVTVFAVYPVSEAWSWYNLGMISSCLVSRKKIRQRAERAISSQVRDYSSVQSDYTSRNDS